MLIVVTMVGLDNYENIIINDNAAYTCVPFIYRSITKVISLRRISKVFSHFLYINGLHFTINVIKFSCHFIPLNHINL